MTNVSKQTIPATTLPSFDTPYSRRSLIAGVIAAGLGAGLLPAVARADTSPDDVNTIFTIAQTAEQLAVTFYSNGVKSAQAGTLKDANGKGLDPDELNYLRAALIEEQLHQLFFYAAQTGSNKMAVQIPNMFNFPANTFTDLATFIGVQQTLEGVFDSAFIAAVYEFGLLNRADLARIACQVAMIESEHRVLGRDILIAHGLDSVANDPADNWTYAPQLLASVGAAPGVVEAAGFFNAQNTGDYAYQQVYNPLQSGDPLGLAAVAANIQYKDGPVAPPTGMGGGAATPELSSGELLTTGLVPLAGLLWYRARRGRRAQESCPAGQEMGTDTNDKDV